jgi:hypothetical protein
LEVLGFIIEFSLVTVVDDTGFGSFFRFLGHMGSGFICDPFPGREPVEV